MPGHQYNANAPGQQYAVNAYGAPVPPFGGGEFIERDVRVDSAGLACAPFGHLDGTVRRKKNRKARHPRLAHAQDAPLHEKRFVGGRPVVHEATLQRFARWLVAQPVSPEPVDGESNKDLHEGGIEPAPHQIGGDVFLVSTHE